MTNKLKNCNIQTFLTPENLKSSKSVKQYWESPTQRFRRRALLEKQNPSVNLKTFLHSESKDSTLNYEELMNGVVAYVDVKSGDKDRSEGVMILMRSMGATISDQLTKEVTHVIFKDGYFTTYQKAKLLGVHFLSILWVEAVRSTGSRVPEAKFPALGTQAYDYSISDLCSTIQKDYEDIISEETRRSLGPKLFQSTPLPNNRRKTLAAATSVEYDSNENFDGKIPNKNTSLNLVQELTFNKNNTKKNCTDLNLTNRTKYPEKFGLLEERTSLSSCLYNLQITREKELIDETAYKNRADENVSITKKSLRGSKLPKNCIQKSKENSTSTRFCESSSNSSKRSFSPLNSSIIDSVLHVLKTPPLNDEYVTQRKNKPDTPSPAKSRRNTKISVLEESSAPKIQKIDKNSPRIGLVDRNNKPDKQILTNQKNGRKLFDPSDCIKLLNKPDVSDEKEREKIRYIKAKNRRSLSVDYEAKNNVLLTQNAKTLMENKNTSPKKVLNQIVEEKFNEYVKKLEKKEKHRKKPKKQNKNKNINMLFNSDEDEQKELANEILLREKTNKGTGILNALALSHEKKRRSCRITKLKKNKNTEDIMLVNRRSIMEFQTISQKEPQKKKKKETYDCLYKITQR